MSNYIYQGKKTAIEYSIDWGLNTSYETSLDVLHPDITWKHVTIGSYHGDIISIGYDKEGNWYYKMNGYGSCSGCDWICGISEVSEAEEFYKSQEVLVELGKDVIGVKAYLEKEIKNVWGFEENQLVELNTFIDAKAKEQGR